MDNANLMSFALRPLGFHGKPSGRAEQPLGYQESKFDEVNGSCKLPVEI
jgi:hypothetical protein